MAFLQVISGLNPGQQYTLTREKSILGRHPDCDILLDVGAVSRNHAQILHIGKDYFVEDLKSRNGTYVNGEAIQGRRALQDQDQLKICDHVFTFHHDIPLPRRAAFDTDSSGSRKTAVMVDDSELTTSSTIMSKLDVSTSGSGLRVTVNPEVKLRAMLEITRNLAKSLALEEVLPKILDSLFKVFVQADRGFIVLRDTPDGPLVPKAVRYRRNEEDESARISRTVVNKAMETGEALLSADAASDSRFQMSESIADFRIRSMMCAPLIDSSMHALGVIQIDTLDQRSRFTQDDLDVLASVASQAAFAVENAQLHETTMRQKSIERDLQLAHKVQRALLPSAPPKVPGYEFFDFYEAANAVGGDYYDYICLPDNRYAVIVADVSGKGIAAALLMAKVSADARYCLAIESSPATAVCRLNASFTSEGWEDRFVTFLLALIDPRTHKVTIVNAGHMAPFVRRANGEIEAPGEEQTGVPLAVSPDFPYEECSFKLAPGEMVCMFTDGISEALDGEKAASGDPDAWYGTERIKKQMVTKFKTVADLGKLILDDVKLFVGNTPQSDDICLMCFGRTRD